MKAYLCEYDLQIDIKDKKNAYFEKIWDEL